MLMTPIEPSRPHASYMVVRLLRRWSAAAATDEARLPSLVRLAAKLGIAPEAAVALASLFELTEACLGRPLEAECCCSSRLSRDEQALLMMLTVAPAKPHAADTSIPHGLPGALPWAVRSVRRLLGDAGTPLPFISGGGCPFGPIGPR